MKKCRKCGIEKNKNEFYNKFATCKTCYLNSKKENYKIKINNSFDNNKLKKCIICKLLKPATDQYFYIHKLNKDGLHYYCKECYKIYMKYYDSKRKLENRKNLKIIKKDNLKLSVINYNYNKKFFKNSKPLNRIEISKNTFIHLINSGFPLHKGFNIKYNKKNILFHFENKYKYRFKSNDNKYYCYLKREDSILKDDREKQIKYLIKINNEYNDLIMDKSETILQLIYEK